MSRTIAFPCQTQWRVDGPLLDYRCGGSVGIDQQVAPTSRFTPFTEKFMEHLKQCGNFMARAGAGQADFHVPMIKQAVSDAVQDAADPGTGKSLSAAAGLP